jgi:hypothetical protein
VPQRQPKPQQPPKPEPYYISEHNPADGPLPPGWIDDSEDILGGLESDTVWDGEVEDPPHDRIYAEVDRRAAEAKAAAEKKPKSTPKKKS